MRVLHVSYDGALDPLGRSQVVPYLEGLAGAGHEIDVLTWEKPERAGAAGEAAGMRDRLGEAGIRWHPLGYHRRPPVASTLYDLWRGRRRARALIRERGFDLVHARSYPAALVAWSLRRGGGPPYLFDMRGLYAEERVEGGLWREGGLLYRVTRALEARFLRDAAGVVTLTEASIPEVEARMARAGSRARLRVIPTCVDVERFLPAPAPAGPFTLAYVGSVGTWYMLDEMLDFGRVALEEIAGSRLLFLTNAEPAGVRDRAEEAGIDADRLDVRSVSHGSVAGELAAVSATYFFIRPVSSKVASAATKFAESLAVGRPVALNPGVGDAPAVVSGEGVGVVVPDFTDEAYRAAVRDLRALASEPATAERCRRVAEERFALEEGVRRYRELYAEVAGRREDGP